MLALICWLCASTVGLVHTWSSYALSQFACTAVQVAITAQYAMRLDCSVQTTLFLLLKLTTHSWSYACDAWTETMITAVLTIPLQAAFRLCTKAAHTKSSQRGPWKGPSDLWRAPADTLQGLFLMLRSALPALPFMPNESSPMFAALYMMRPAKSSSFDDEGVS